MLTSRSGVSSKTHLVIETGKIDAGFHGNMKINIKNDAQSSGSFVSPNVIGVDNSEFQPFDEKEYDVGTYQINKGDKLAQLVLVPIWTPELEQVEEFTSESARGEKGFGSSGF
ncbi:hypothetical protein ACJVVW_09695 [Staphylococcus coagulans]|uniref:hypothetical protein n=1 Tax=Staphylococcus coagulans TaxID=74706 RepID=UPI0039810A83